MAQGETIDEIGAELDLSGKTISNVSRAIKGRLGVENQAQITRLAVRQEIVEA